MKPPNPIVGQIYFDVEGTGPLIYHGSEWKTVPPPKVDTRTDKEKVWDALSKPVQEEDNIFVALEYLYASCRILNDNCTRNI